MCVYQETTVTRSCCPLNNIEFGIGQLFTNPLDLCQGLRYDLSFCSPRTEHFRFKQCDLWFNKAKGDGKLFHGPGEVAPTKKAP